MTSVTLPRRAHNLHSIREHRNNRPYTTDDEETKSIVNNNYHYFSNQSKIKQPTRAISYDEPKVPLSPVTNNNRFRHLYSRFKRRFTLTRDHRTRSEDINEMPSERSIIGLNNFKSISSSTDDDPFDDFEWPDFEKIYNSMPACLINALPGIDDYSTEENYHYILNKSHLQNDRTDEYSTEQMNLFLQCRRGKCFRRNAVCQKLDKSQHHGQLNTFIRQLMIEKLMRTWS